MRDPTKTLENVASNKADPGAPCELGPLLFRLLCADDLSQAPARYSLSGVAGVSFGRARAADAVVTGETMRIAVPDPFVSASHAQLEQNWDSAWHVRDNGSRNGTVVNGEWVRAGEVLRLRDGDLLEIGHTFFLFRGSARGLAHGRAAAPPTADDPLTLNPEWELVLSKAERLARTTHEILIQGESGVGKEVLARFLHEKSG